MGQFRTHITCDPIWSNFTKELTVKFEVAKVRGHRRIIEEISELVRSIIVVHIIFTSPREGSSMTLRGAK